MGRAKIVLAIVVLAFVLRFVGVSSFPAGFSPDEANQGYTAFSILKTGKDEWGEAFPVMPRSYGDYRAPLYTYLTTPSVLFFGLNEFSVRLPNVIIGTLAVAVIYLLCVELFRKSEIDGHRVGIWASFLMAISPWLIPLSRGAFEPNLPTLLIPLGILLFIKGQEKRHYLALAAVALGLSLFAYYSSRLLLPFILLGLYIFYLRAKKPINFVKNHYISLVILSAFILIAGYTMLFGASTRVMDVAIFSSKDVLAQVADQKYQSVLLGLPDLVARIFSNKVVYISSLFVRNYLGYFSPEFLFTGGPSEATYGMMPGIGLFYLIEALFMAISMGIIILKKYYKDQGIAFLLFLLLVSPIPAALSTGLGHAANRAALMAPWLIILSAVGANHLVSKLKALKYIISFCFLIGLSFFLIAYFFRAPIQNSRSMSYGFRDASRYIKSVSDLYSTIVVSRSFSEPQMLLAFYLQIDPKIIQDESRDWLRYENEGLKFVDQLGEYRLGKFIFKNIDKSYDLLRSNALVVGKPQDFPASINPDHVVYYPDGSEAIYILSVGESYAQKY